MSHSHRPDPPLASAANYAKGCGLTTVTVWRDPTVLGGLALAWTPDVDLYPGTVGKLRTRVWNAVQDMSRNLDDREVLTGEMQPWTLTCGTAAILTPGLPRYDEAA